MKIIFQDIDDSIISRRSATAKGWFADKKDLEYSDLIDPLSMELTRISQSTRCIEA